jgi:hypothetical protein
MLTRCGLFATKAKRSLSSQQRKWAAMVLNFDDQQSLYSLLMIIRNYWDVPLLLPLRAPPKFEFYVKPGSLQFVLHTCDSILGKVIAIQPVLARCLDYATHLRLACTYYWYGVWKR